MNQMLKSILTLSALASCIYGMHGDNTFIINLTTFAIYAYTTVAALGCVFITLLLLSGQNKHKYNVTVDSTYYPAWFKYFSRIAFFSLVLVMAGLGHYVIAVIWLWFYGAALWFKKEIESQREKMIQSTLEG
jgi:hypothetical protein